MIEVINAISENVSAGLAAAGYPKLLPFPNGKPGRILIGEPVQFGNFSPPRIIFRPTKATWSGRSNSMGPVRAANNNPGPDAERRASAAVRSLFTELHTFEVYACGVTPHKTMIDRSGGTADPEAINYEFTLAIYRQLIASLQIVMPGNFKLSQGGNWEPFEHLDVVVYQFVFGVEIEFPVLAELPPTPYAPAVNGEAAVLGHPRAPALVVPNISDEFITNPSPGEMNIKDGQGTPAGDDGWDITSPAAGARKAGPGCEE